MNGKSMKENKRKLDKSALNQKIQERLERLNKSAKNSPKGMEKPEKKKGVNNEEGD